MSSLETSGVGDNMTLTSSERERINRVESGPAIETIILSRLSRVQASDVSTSPKPQPRSHPKTSLMLYPLYAGTRTHTKPLTSIRRYLPVVCVVVGYDSVLWTSIRFSSHYEMLRLSVIAFPLLFRSFSQFVEEGFPL